MATDGSTSSTPRPLTDDSAPVGVNRSRLAMPLYLALLLAIAVAGLLLRVIDLSTVPPGLHFDQAANGLLALDILNGNRPVFFPSYTGREALFMYVAAGLFAALGPGVFALRLAGALSGVATVIGVALLGSALYGRRVGLVSSALLAGLYWHVHISRLGERTILVPMLDVFALLALWSGFRRRPAALVAVGGALVGLQLYTYPSSRFFVVFAVGFGILEFGLAGVTRRARDRLVRRSSDHADVGGSSSLGRPRSAPSVTALGIVALVCAVVVIAPLASYFYNSPADFLGRADQVAIWNPQTIDRAPDQAALTSVWATLRMFVVNGDQDWKYNLAGQPVFDWITGTFFLVGMAVALREWRLRANRLCLLWLLAMLVPGFLSVDAPQFMRTLGASPGAVLLAARGIEASIGWLSAQSKIRRLVPVLWAWPLVAGGLTAYHYFGVWAPSAAAYRAEEGDVTAAAAIIRTQSPKYPITYVASRYGSDPTESFLDGDLFGRLRWFDGRAALPLPPPGSPPTLYVLPRSAVDPTWYERLPAESRIATVIGPDGAPSVEAFVLTGSGLTSTGDPVIAKDGSAGADFGGLARLLSIDLPDAAQPGLDLTPTLTWQLEHPGADRLQFFVHVVDATGASWLQYDDEIYPSTQWQASQTLIVRRSLPLPEFLPPGRYRLQVGLERPDGSPLPVTSGEGNALGNDWESAPFTVVRAPRPPNPASLDVDRRFNVVLGDSMRLIGVTVGTSKISDGDSIPLTLFWQVVKPPSGNPETVVKAVDATGKQISETVQRPTGGAWPTDQWQTGDVVVDREKLLVPAGTSTGPLNLLVGLQTAGGLPIVPSIASSPTVPIGTINVERRPRSTIAPIIGHPVDVRFDQSIRLIGYDVEPTSARPGDAVLVRLYWSTEAPTSDNWTVFAHLLDRQEQVRAQQDALPAAGQRPTTTWAPGETIVDAHSLLIQPATEPGNDRLEIGLYDSSSGRRLKTLDGNDRVLLDVPVEVQR